MRNFVSKLRKLLTAGLLAPLFLLTTAYAANPISIMPLGDSITYDGYSTHDSAYRGPLWTELSTNAGYTVNFVGEVQQGSIYRDTIDPTFILNHEGYNGWTADQMAANIDVILGNNPANIILLHIGTNDLSSLTDPTSPVIDQTVTEVEDILDKIDAYSTDIKVVLAKIINHDMSDDAATREVTTTFNTKLETMALARIDNGNGDDIEIVDIENDAGIDYTVGADMYDWLHPNDTGYAKMADLWAKQLKTIIPMHKWKLDEAAAPYIDTMRDVNGNCTDGCPLVTASGKIDNAQEFTDTDTGGIDVTDVSTFNWAADESFTIELWMRSNENGATRPDGTEDNAILMGREDTGGNLLWYIGTSKTSGKAIFYADGIYALSNSDIADGNWHHVVSVRDADNNETKMYIDGVLQDDVEVDVVNTDLDGGTSAVNIGHLNWYDINPDETYEYNGLLDEIAVYGGALNVTQIQRHFNDTESTLLTITSTPVTFAELNTLYTYDVNTSSDPFATFELTASPSWMDPIDADGLISGTPDTVGNFDVAILATDTPYTAPQNYVLKVRDTSNLPGSMEHYWKLDETSGSIYTDTYLGADGNCIGGCPTDTAGQVGIAQEFTDAEIGGIDVNDTETFNWAADESFTIELWMRSNDNGATRPDGTEDNAILMGREDTGGNLLWYIGTNKTSGKAIFHADGVYAVSNSDIADGDWHHVVSVRDADNNETKMYIDGVLQVDVEVDVVNVDLDGGTSAVNIGHLNWYAVNPDETYEYNGLLDEIAVFDSALTPTEIQQHFDNGSNGNGFETQPGINPPVVVTPIGDQSSVDKDVIDMDISVNFNDPDGDTLTYSATNLPAGLSLDSNSGVISGKIRKNGSPYSVTITADDGNGGTVSDSFTWMVDNNPPVVVTPIGDQSSVDKDAIDMDISVNFNDPDGDALTYSATNLPAGLSLDSNSGIISGTISNSGSPYSVTITADDSNGGTVNDSFTWTVNAANKPPVVVTPIGDQSSVDKDAIDMDISVNFNDPDGDALTYSATNLPAGLSLDSNSGIISGTISNSGSPYSVAITADDGKDGTVSDSFTWTVTTVTPPANNPPVVETPIDDQNNVDGDAINMNISGNFSDPDGDTLTYSATNLPAGLSLNATSGIISGTISNSGSPYSVAITADDGKDGTVSDSFTWTVTTVTPPANNPPTANAGADQTVQVNNTITITGSGTDTDGKIVSYKWTKDGIEIATTASFSYTPDTVGTDTLTLTVTDDGGETDTDSMNVTVTSDEIVLPDWAIDESNEDGNKIRVIPPEGVEGESTIATEGVESTVVVSPEEDSVTLSHKINDASGCIANIVALNDGRVITGYSECENGTDLTLKEGTAFAPGTQSVIKEQGGTIVIESTVNLNNNDSFTIGGR